MVVVVVAADVIVVGIIVVTADAIAVGVGIVVSPLLM